MYNDRRIPFSLVAILSLFLLEYFFDANIAQASEITLRPPYDGQYPLTSFFDHYYPDYGDDNEITIYTGESVSNCNPHCYKGHPGYDWSMVEGTPTLAVADGVVENRIVSSSGYGNRLIIRHSNGYYSLYAHLSESNPFNVLIGDTVNQGDIIGWSGTTGNSSGPHLHFGVYLGPVTSDEANVTDPFGWRGSYADPLNQFGNGHTASCLWRDHDTDPIACVDTIVEDAGAGFTISGTWSSSEIGNGFHMYYRGTTTENDHATWCFPTPFPGGYKFYAWIPWYNATSQSADYGIWTADGWVTVPINQDDFYDEWVSLGTYMLNKSVDPSYNCVVLLANTGEPPGTKSVGVDAIRRRTYLVFLSLVFKL